MMKPIEWQNFILNGLEVCLHTKIPFSSTYHTSFFIFLFYLLKFFPPLDATQVWCQSNKTSIYL